MMYRSRRRTMIVQPIPGIIYPRLLQMLTTLLAQMRSADRVRKRLLLGVDRTYRRHVLNDANDPEQKSQTKTVRTSDTDSSLRIRRSGVRISSGAPRW